MTVHELIERIQMAKRLEDVVAMPDWRTDYKKLLLIIHPDVCSLSGASLATSKLNALKDKFEKGETFSDESGNFHSNGFKKPFTELHADRDFKFIYRYVVLSNGGNMPF